MDINIRNITNLYAHAWHMLAANRKHHWCEIWQQISEPVLSPSLLSYLVLESIKLVKLQVVQMTCLVAYIKVYVTLHGLKKYIQTFIH